MVYDPDWLSLGKPALLALQRWVDAGGGLFVVAGPINTPQLAGTAGGDEGKIARELLPVVVDKPKDTEASGEPRRLNFPREETHRFLKLDDKGKDPLAGWHEFFFAGEKLAEDSPVRGFYACQAVKSVKKTAMVLATLAPRPAPGESEPYLVVMPRGKGMVSYLGSAELCARARVRRRRLRSTVDATTELHGGPERTGGAGESAVSSRNRLTASKKSSLFGRPVPVALEARRTASARAPRRTGARPGGRARPSRPCRG